MIGIVAEKKLKTPLNQYERNCLNFLKKEQPSLVPYFINVMEEGRRGILFKLASSLLREDILGLYTSSVSMKKIGSVFVMGLKNVTEDWECLLRQLQKEKLRENITYLIYTFQRQLLVFPVAREYAFGRFQLTDDILHITNEGIDYVMTASELLTILSDKLPNQGNALQDELENGTANYMLALAYYKQWEERVQQEGARVNADTALQYARMKGENDSLWNSSLFFEQLSSEGHHLHPGAKTKTGMMPRDVFHFSPEFQQIQSICFVAVKKEYLNYIESEPNLIEIAFPSLAKTYRLMMKEKGYDHQQYRILPIHEWQFKNTLEIIYADEVDKGIVVLLENLILPGEASSSFRTIWPKGVGYPALKLAINSQMTSTIRSISQQTALNSLAFTRIIQAIKEREPALEHFQPINEIAGYSFRSEKVDKSRNLTVVVRESMDEKVGSDELAVAGCSLYHISPLSGKTILWELVEEYCENLKLERNVGVISFLRDYLTIVLPGFLTLMVKYGVGLEGHLQNSVPVFRKGKLVRFYFRDWGGARVVEERLSKQGIASNLAPGSLTITKDDQELRNKVFYTVFQNHLGEIIVQLCQQCGVPEKELWKVVKTCCDTIFSNLDGEGVKSAQKDAITFYQPLVEYKALTKMRLYPNDSYLYSKVTNPLKRERAR